MTKRIKIPLRRFWAKLERDAEGRVLAWHPLEAHAADVAAVLEGLLGLPVIAAKLERAAGMPLDSSLRSRLCVLAALHDVGKYSQGFQAKSDPTARETCGHLQALPGLFSEQCLAEVAEMFSWLAHWDRVKGEVASRFLKVAWSHHGRPVAPEQESQGTKDRYAVFWQGDAERDPLAGLKELLNLVRRWYPAAFTRDACPLPDAPASEHLYCGLMILADWLASDTRFFPFCGQNGRPVEGDPMPFARRAARRALRLTGLNQQGIRPKGTHPSFEQQFGFAPNPLQEAVDRLPLQPEGGLVVLEAETGAGKTEAALRYFSRLFWAGLVDGLYFANPLRLAATQLQSRVLEFSRRSFGSEAPAVVLAVPGYLQADDQQGYRLPDFGVLWPDADDPLQSLRFWAAESPKRYLCAPLAVGTIDQALMATLRLPHAHLRAAALSRSLLVVDEAHASDAYMTPLTLGLIDLFRRCGGQVLVMSATLGGVVRRRYLQAMHGEVPGVDDMAACLAAPYPLLSHRDGAIPLAAGGSGRSKAVAVCLHPCQDDPGRVAVLAAQAARKGACVLVLRNTVRDAVVSCRVLEKELAGEPELLFRVKGVGTLHHSRFAAADRRSLDREVVRRFGKDRRARQPGVLVATQTLEQSLDVDFDLLLTDLCPMDVLLQRIGRLHRHPAGRPPGFAQPVCHLMVPSPRDPLVFFSPTARHHGYGRDRAYVDLRILEATWRELERLAEADEPLLIPEMNRHLVEHATHPQILEDLAQELGEKWLRHGQEVAGRGLAMDLQAGLHLIRWDQPYGPGSAAPRVDEVRAATRLGLDDRKVYLAGSPLGPFAYPVSELKVPGWMLPDGFQPPKEIEARPLAEMETGLEFELADRRFRYDRLGLRSAEEET